LILKQEKSPLESVRIFLNGLTGSGLCNGLWNKRIGGVFSEKDGGIQYSTMSVSKKPQFLMAETICGLFAWVKKNTGIPTSVQEKDQSLVGAMFVDTAKTEEDGVAIYFPMQGTDENGVVEAADSSLGADSTKWQPDQPIMYNIYGTPTWILPIISTEGIFQKVSVVNVDNINILATEVNLERALAKYRNLLSQRGNEIAPTETSVLKQIGPVAVMRVGDTVLGGEKTYLVMVEGHTDKLFASSGETDDTRLVALVQPGDMVLITFIDTEEPVIPIEVMKVQGIELRVSRVQSAYDAQREVSKQAEDDVSAIRDTEKAWESLTLEEKKALLEKMLTK
jgi:hypothetical protein